MVNGKTIQTSTSTWINLRRRKMPYKISGTIGSDARIIIIKESDWSVESNTDESSGSFAVENLDSGKKTVIARKSDGEVLAYGNISSEEYTPAIGDRGVFGGGYSNDDTMQYITISTTGNSTDFGNLTFGRHGLGAASNGATGRGVFAGGTKPFDYVSETEIDYITISTTGNAQDFGDLSNGKTYPAATSNGTNDRGVFGGDYDPDSNIIEYITISTTGNSSDFGDLSQTNRGFDACSNGTNNRGVFGGGYSGGLVNTIEYITINSAGNTTDFGDLLSAINNTTATSNGTNNRGVWMGGDDGSQVNTIQYITITSTGNATDFGDLTQAGGEISQGAATSNKVNERGVFGGGDSASTGDTNVIQYITINSTGNSTDFGDLLDTNYSFDACANA